MITILGYSVIFLLMNICSASSYEKEYFDTKLKLAYAGQWEVLWNVIKEYQQYNQNRLVQASSVYKWHEVKEIVKKYGKMISLNQSDNSGKFPLWYAVEAPNYQMIQLLLEHGADPNRPLKLRCRNMMELREQGNTVLFEAAYQGDVQAASLLLEGGANPHVKNAMGSTPLFAAVQAECVSLVELLIKRGATANVQENLFYITDFPGSIVGGDTPLIFAATKNNLKMVRLLLEEGARNIGAKNSFGQTARAAAMVHGNREILEAFDHATPQDPDEPKFKIISFTRSDIWG